MEAKEVKFPKLTEIGTARSGRRGKILTRWRREHRRKGELSFPGNGRQAFNKEQTRIRELEKQLRDVEMERNILKKAVAIFSRQP